MQNNYTQSVLEAGMRIPMAIIFTHGYHSTRRTLLCHVV